VSSQAYSFLSKLSPRYGAGIGQKCKLINGSVWNRGGSINITIPVENGGGNLLRTTLIIMIATLVIGSLEASAADWKFLGGALLKKKSGETLAFYDAESVQYLSSGNVRVWTKAVDASEVDRLATKKKEIIKTTAEKVANGYYPPYVLSNSNPQPSFDTYMEIVAWEQAANHAEIKPKAKLLYEINCKGKMIQNLSAVIHKGDGRTASTSDIDKWNYISPESNGETLQKILCNGKK
jgi:hypothetical protein